MPQQPPTILPHKGYSLLGALLLLVAACYSVGYHGEDEHHQTIGLALARAGELPANEVVWEYGERIRATALPWLVTGLFSVTEIAGNTDPFIRTWLLRLLTAMLAWVVTYHFLRATIPRLPTELHGAYQLLTWCLWFMPFLHVRFAAETWSGLWLLAGLAIMMGPVPRSRALAWAGACLAMAIWIRPPVAMCAIGIVGWWCFAHGVQWKRTSPFVAGAMAVLVVSVVADSVFYGTPTCSIVRYTYMGIVGDPAHAFGSMPWWYYFPWVVKYALPPIGACILLAFAVLLWKDRSHPLVWVILPFVLLHIVVPHKELRFLYPLAPLMPLLLMEAYQRSTALRHRRALTKALIAVVIVCNIPALVVAVLTPAGNGRVALARQLERSGDGHAALTYMATSDTWRIIVPRFYRPGAPAWEVVRPGEDPIRSDLLITDNQSESPADFTPVAGGQPTWAIPLLDLYYWGEWRGAVGLSRRAEVPVEEASHR